MADPNYKFVILQAGKSVPRVSESGFCVLDVAGDLSAEFVEGGEFLFVAELFDQGEFEFLIVEVALEIEEVGFDVEFGVRVVEGRTITYIYDSAYGGVLGEWWRIGHDSSMSRINTFGRQNQAGGVEVGSREAELLAKVIAFDNFA